MSHSTAFVDRQYKLFELRSVHTAQRVNAAFFTCPGKQDNLPHFLLYVSLIIFCSICSNI